ncbi:uncharacterized protein LOC142589915 isoform X3 [Dermacentor variabilis]|uniref:uncharacterized protein LOC142589915 isoform X3 n=1 Tax=Dermacentor variabilis TaxID=34621 RepID=UPI003F5B3163
MRNEVTVAMGHSMGGHWFWLDHLSPEALRPIWIVLGLRTVYSERPGQPKHGTFSVHCDKHTDGFDGHGNSCDTLHRRWSLVLGHLSPEALRPIWIDLGLRTVYSERPGQPKHGTFSVHCDKHSDGFDGHGNSCDTLHRRWSLVLDRLSPEASLPIWIDLGLSSVLGAPRAINTRSLLQEMWKAHRRLRWTLQ